MKTPRVASWPFLCAGLAATFLGTAALAAEAGPDFVTGIGGWGINDAEPAGASTDFHPVPGEPTKPVTYDIKHPYASNLDIFKRMPTPRIADLNNAILQPWAKDIIKATNDDVLATGKFPFTSEQRCWPGGVPGLLVYPGRFYYIQKPNEVWFIDERDHQIRRIYMNVPHQANPGYSWYGDEIGHYENGDTLAIDTIGLDDKGPVDNYRTPHTKQLHVSETQQLDSGRTRIFMNITVDDPGAFTTPWKAWKVFKRTGGPRPVVWDEVVCAENNPDYFDERPVSMPTATKLDF